MNLSQRLLCRLIRLYQLTLSVWVGRDCRYLPTCSQYAMEAVARHGALRGGWLAVGRILRCHPFGGRGYDPVPNRFSWRCICADCTSGRKREGESLCDSSLFHS